MEERERACDEAVLSLGNEPQVYAEGILNVCESYLESPLRCVSGVTGADLKKRIRAILTKQVAGRLSFARKATLAGAAVAAVAAPILAGMMGAPSIRALAQTQSTDAAAASQAAAWNKTAFAVASIRPVQNMHSLGVVSTSGPRLDMAGENFRGLIMYAYDVKNYQIVDSPAVAAFVNDWYEVHAEADVDAKPTTDQFRRMLQSLLADRFNLKFHYEMREMPVYDLIVGKHGPKFKASDPKATPSGYHGVDGSNQTMSLTKTTMQEVAQDLQLYARRPVQDKTGLTGMYDIKFEAAVREGPDAIDVFGAVQEQLGLKLVPQKEKIRVMVVDHVEKPSAN